MAHLVAPRTQETHPVKTLVFFALIIMFGSVMASAGEQLATKVPDLAQLQKMTARFAPTELNVDIGNLSEGDRKALVKLVEAARIIDDIFMMQYWSGDLALYAKLQKDTSPLGKARLHYFWINKSPWSELDNNTAFIPGVPEHKLPGANFYPETMTKEQFESWVKTLPEKQQEQAKGFFTVIRSDGKSGFKIVPYSEAYKTDLTRAANSVEGSGVAHRQCDAETLPEHARRGLPLQRLLRERRCVDGPRRSARHHHRAVRDLQRRAVRLQGIVRSLRQRARRGGERQAGRVLQESAGDRRPSSDRSEVSQSEDRRTGAHPRGQ